MRFKFFYLISLFLVFSIKNACAQWISNVSGPDVFGNTKVESVGIGNGYGLNISCDDKGKISLNVLISLGGLSSDDVQSIPVNVLIKVDDGKIYHFRGVSGTWNEKFMAIEVSKPRKDIYELIQDISVAKEKINVGIENNSNKDSFSIGVYDSTNAMNKVIKFCKLK
ncbi:hypothetical protein FE249_04215 [Acidiphilium multivorum]|uniref:hypothetical protein n=1 Tax=Acidiphilium multivorum TaxID=62140 RepID=UPI001F4C3773|nr:hypothetical protein [Acidiphilium multivorum]UNC13493.1 hypothetical protein FE249_04215 [Acidiphilium multivorum]